MVDELIFELLQELLDHGLLRPRSVAQFGRVCVAERDRERDTPINDRRLLLEILLRADEEGLIWSDAPEFGGVLRRFVNRDGRREVVRG